MSKKLLHTLIGLTTLVSSIMYIISDSIELLESGFSIRDLTCARIGCFRAAVQSLASIECDYAVTSLNIDDHCEGYIERS